MKKYTLIYLLFLTELFNCWIANSQCPISSFSVGNSYCISEEINLTNNSTDADSYAWDFCSGELFEDPKESFIYDLIGSSNTQGISIVQDNNKWYGFITDRNANKIYRLDFGSSLENTPTQTNLNISGAALNLAIPIQVVKDNGQWYGMIHNGTGKNILRLNIGADIESTDATLTEVVTNIGANGDRLELKNDNGNWTAILISNTSLKIINFGDNITNIPNSTDDILTSSTFSGARFLDLSLLKSCDTWYGLAVGYSNSSLYHLDFGTDLFSTPTINLLSTSLYNDNPLSIELTIHNDEFLAFSQDDNGEFYRIGLGDDLDNIVLSSTSYTDFTSGVVIGFSLFNEKGVWKGLQLKNSGELYKIIFPLECGATIAYSHQETPTNIYYNQSGTYNISLLSSDAYGVLSEDYHQVTISENTAPAISFESPNQCISQPNIFTPVDEGGLTYSWDYDNDGTEDDNATIGNYTFGSLGEHVVALTVNDGTCSNFVKDTISIYPEPIAPTFFTSGTPYCTGADITFTNLFDESDFNGATLTYEWNYNGEGTSSERNGAFNFDTEETKTVTLTASIPGCSTTSAEPDLDLIAGPAVDFNFADQCLGDDTQFTNLTTGSNITGQTWSFGDTESSASSSPSHTYAATGHYEVTLTVNNSGGCNNVLSKSLTINDKPVADFNMGVGCEGQEVGFEDQSTVNDANIEIYSWDFASEGNSNDQDPRFTFETQGTYPVTLTVESSFGCTDEAVKNIDIQVTPSADFDVDIGCLEKTTLFLDQTETESTNPIITWYWDIDGDIKPNTQNPTEIFDIPGVYSATLTVTPNNLCVSTISKDFTIHELPVADFTSDNTCDNEAAIFTDASTSATTSIVTQHWQFDEEGTGSSNPGIFHFDQAGDYEVSLTIADNIGCESTVQQTVTINPSPVAAFEVNRDIGPAPLTIDFTNQSTGANSYLWKYNDSENTTSTEENSQFAYSELGDYNPELISTNGFGCSDTTNVQITVAEPILDLELAQVRAEEANGKTNLSLTVRNNGNVAIRDFDIRIDLDNNSSIYETYNGTIYKNESVTFPLNFTFATDNNNIGYVCITLSDQIEEYADINALNNEGCIDFDQQLVVEDTYPNPIKSSDSKIRLNMILPAKAPVQIFLLDATGNILYQEVYMDTNTGLNSFFLDIYAYRQGIYFIKAVYNQTASTQRFVKI